MQRHHHKWSRNWRLDKTTDPVINPKQCYFLTVPCCNLLVSGNFPFSSVIFQQLKNEQVRFLFMCLHAIYILWHNASNLLSAYNPEWPCEIHFHSFALTFWASLVCQSPWTSRNTTTNGKNMALALKKLSLMGLTDHWKSNCKSCSLCCDGRWPGWPESMKQGLLTLQWGLKRSIKRFLKELICKLNWRMIRSLVGGDWCWKRVLQAGE